MKLPNWMSRIYTWAGMKMGATLTPPPVGAYVWSGSAWEPLTTTGGTDATFTPPPYAMYAYNGTAWTQWTGGGGGGSVDITSSTGNLTVSPSPITGTGTIDINLAHSNNWTAPQNFSSGIGFNSLNDYAFSYNGTLLTLDGNSGWGFENTGGTPVFLLPSNGYVMWASGTTLPGLWDTELARAAPGVVGISTSYRGAFTGGLQLGTIQLSGTPTSVVGSTSGTASFYQTNTGSGYKKVVIYCSSLVGTASYTFPTAFSHTPMVVIDSNAGGVPISVITTGGSLSATAVTLNGSTATGFLMLEGY